MQAWLSLSNSLKVNEPVIFINMQKGIYLCSLERFDLNLAYFENFNLFANVDI